MEQFFRELFEYNHHSNQQLGMVFDSRPEYTSAKAVRLFSHLLNAHRIWNNRIDPGEKLPGVWEVQEVRDFIAIDRTNHAHTLRILESVDLNAAIHYLTTSGEPFTNSVREIAFHIINHSTYHRGQIATEFRNNGLEPLSTDYIFYKR